MNSNVIAIIRVIGKHDRCSCQREWGP